MCWHPPSAIVPGQPWPGQRATRPCPRDRSTSPWRVACCTQRMSEGLNMVTLFGNLGADPELTHTQGGPLLKRRLATTEVYYDKEKKKQERTEWHRVKVWGRRAEGLSKILTKG